MTDSRQAASLAVLREITAAVGLSAAGAEPIRLAENDLWRLPGNIVVRISRGGQEAAAAREVAVTRWLADHDVPAVRPLPMDQPIVAGGRPATFWEELPPHRPGTAVDLAPLLRRLHDLPPPDFPLGTWDPFVRLDTRIAAARSISDDDRGWLLRRLETLRREWLNLPPGQPECVIHGDAWGGNCALTADGPVLLDFERTSLGRPEWDLTAVAVEHDTLAELSEAEYRRFCDAYGTDVMTWPGYPTLRGIRELRKVTFAFQIADQDPNAMPLAHYRIACLQGHHGPRPWTWTAVA
ncbi:aminoglycoside phosphotransferase family protein [Streptomyces sp. 8K308]|uniref:phosphotransferase family protein n=1 Tax=Streptomyces sp. 8K308 TaxID=2530388 RepID=UPI0010472D4D|nr:aminoglycoside phosphotransferase family protein [Streptomyces sp. 8K308]TDC25404.1 aminoglycoside phosphotransferase family protein [Streptomyces sp. 8K308]